MGILIDRNNLFSRHIGSARENRFEHNNNNNSEQ